MFSFYGNWFEACILILFVDMKEEELRYFENLCDKLYGQSTPQEKQSAGEELAAITKNPSFISDVK